MTGEGDGGGEEGQNGQIGVGKNEMRFHLIILSY